LRRDRSLVGTVLVICCTSMFASSAIAEATAPALTLGSRITELGIGPVRIGMTAAQAEQAAGHQVQIGIDINLGCRSDTIGPHGYGLSTLTRNGRIATMFVGRRGLATSRGIRVGDSVGKLRRAYRSTVHRTKNFYGSPYYVVRAGNRQIHFGVPGRRITDVTRIRSIETGRKPEILWAEGCV